MHRHFFLFCFLFSYLSAQSPLNLEECQKLALENNDKKTIADLQALIAYDRIGEAKSIGRPQLSAHADYMTSGEAKRVRKNERHAHAKASLVIPLYNFGLTKHTVNSQKTLYQAALFNIDQAEQSLLKAVQEAYFEFLISQKVEWVIQQTIDSLMQHLQVTQDFFHQGLSHRNDVLAIEVQQAQLQQDLLEAQFQSQLARSRLNRLIGIDFDCPTTIQDLFLDTCEPGDLESLIETAKLHHPELHALQAQMQAANEAYLAEKARLYPNIYAFSNYSTTNDYALPYRQGLDAGIAVDILFYDGGNTYAKLRRLKKELTELELRYCDLEKDIELNIRSAFLTIKTALSKIPVALKGIELAKENLRLDQDLFKEGLAATTDILEKEDSLSQARLNYYQALYNYHQAKTHLIYSTGTLYKQESK